LRNQNCRNCFPLKGRITSNRHKFDGCSAIEAEQEANKTTASQILAPQLPTFSRPSGKIEIVVTHSKQRIGCDSNRGYFRGSPLHHSLPFCPPPTARTSQGVPRPCVTISPNMATLRFSLVEYLNTAPLVWGFAEGPLADKYDLSFTVPSQCAEALRRGAADIAIIPAIEYQRIENIVALPGMAVAAKGEVRSILVVAKKPIDMAKKIALDSSSRSSAALVRLL